MIKKNRFQRLLSLANAIARRDGAMLDQRLLRLTIALFLRQEKEIFSDDNRYFTGIGGNDPQDIASLVSWWTEKGEDAFWARRKNIVRRAQIQFSPEQCCLVKNVLQGALALEDDHRHYALREWRCMEERDQNLKLWIMCHAIMCMAHHFQIRFSVQRGGIFP